MQKRLRALCLASVLPLGAPSAAHAQAGASGQEAHRFTGLGGLHWKVRTASPDAQVFFDQGLAFLYAFNHEEAIRAFAEAARLDPSCAMAWWGLATANGPHINRTGIDDVRARAAFDAIQKAKALAPDAPAEARALIEAAALRFQSPAAADWPGRDDAYAGAMRKVWATFPRDPNVGVLFAESLMLLHPWNPWDAHGHPRAGTQEAAQAIDAALRLDPVHPQALHLGIHLWETSPTPARALPMANRLRHRQPGLGHMVHMPSHIDVLLGQWDEAIAANEAALRADAAYRAVRVPTGMQPSYQLHNRHVLGFAAMMAGRATTAIPAMDAIAATLPAEIPQGQEGRMDWYACMPFEARKRFGRWEELLKLEAPGAAYPLARAMRLADRAVALAALNRLEEARAEAAAFEAACKAVPETLKIKFTPAVDVLAVARSLTDGELRVVEGHMAEGLACLRQGVELEDALFYGEPPVWTQPLRHALGAALLRAAQPLEALAVYDADLARWPRNIWSLQGRWQALQALGRKQEAAAAKAAYAQARREADEDVTSSCACLPPRG